MGVFIFQVLIVSSPMAGLAYTCKWVAQLSMLNAGIEMAVWEAPSMGKTVVTTMTNKS